MNHGWVKIHRKIMDHPRFQPDWLTVWIYMLLNATHQPFQKMFCGKVITLAPGQFISGRKEMARKTRVDESKVWRIVETLKTEHQIAHQPGNKSSLFTVLNWGKYQDNEQQNEQQVNNNCTTSEQQLHTLQEQEEGEEHKNYPPVRARRLPANEKEAVSMMSLGSQVPSDFVVAQFLDVASRVGMTTYSGAQIGNWDFYVRSQFLRQSNGKPAMNGHGKPRSQYDLQSQIDTIKEHIGTIQSNGRLEEDGIITDKLTPEAQSKIKAARSKIDELMKEKRGLS